MTRYAMKIEYIGKNYSGSQIQSGNENNPDTIQAELEKALCTLIGDKNITNDKRIIRTYFSGRTDRGVNSKGQIVHFDTDKLIVASQFINSMNGLLPNDISVSDIREVSKDFHAQKSAKKRVYQYVLKNRTQRNAFDGDLLLVRYNLNIARMQKALNYLKGEHDFRAFRSSQSDVSNDVCFIYKAECSKLGDDTVVIDIEGTRFLYNMVRTIVGTLLLIEKDNLKPEYMKEVLESKDRSRAGQTVSPYGLTLIKVEY